ncbi:MAG: hypothetical protein JWP63_4986, partial [Candidatus Solibacter sp.]|nr:hypothetical protein [Candidatus Solibacter sp.]
PLTNGTIRGVVLDAATGAPVAEADVAARPGAGKAVQTTTDAQGVFALRDVPAGKVTLNVGTRSNGTRGFGASTSKLITLGPGQEVTGLTIRLANHAEISGRVLDENKEPVPGVTVFLVAPEYRYGVLRHAYAGGGTTNDRGEYHVTRVVGGRNYLLMAAKRALKLDAISDAPADPKFRKKAIVPTFFPNSPSVDGAMAVSLKPGEKRDGFDIRLLRAPSLCLEATLENGLGPAALRFEVEEMETHNGSSGDGGSYYAMPNGAAGPDGKIRVCELHAGQYKLIASGPPPSADATPFYGYAVVTVGKEDVRNVRVPGIPAQPLTGEVVFDGAPPQKTYDQKLSIDLNAPTRSFRSFPNKMEERFVRAEIPGTFSLPFVLMDEYEIRVSGLPRGLYVKDILYGTQSVKYDVLHAGSAAGNAGLKVVLGQDGGTVTAKVTDQDGNAVSDQNVILMPQNTSSEAQLAAALVFGQTDQNGVYQSPTLPPGKYYLLPTTMTVDRTPQMIDRLSRMRNRAKDVELAPGTSAQVTLTVSGSDQ